MSKKTKDESVGEQVISIEIKMPSGWCRRVTLTGNEMAVLVMHGHDDEKALHTTTLSTQMTSAWQKEARLLSQKLNKCFNLVTFH